MLGEREILAYQGHLTVTSGEPLPLSDEWGDDDELSSVVVINPFYKIDDNAGAGVPVANSVDIMTGNRNGQYNQISVGGNYRIPTNKLSDVYVVARPTDAGAATSVRITFDVYKNRDEDAR